MPHIQRRTFLTAGVVAVSGLHSQLAARGASVVDEALGSGMARRKIPLAVGMAADARKVLYTGAFGRRDSSGPAAGPDTIFRIASMTKAVTTVAALQLVEEGKVDLSEPVSRHLPQLADLEVLEGFDGDGKPSLRPSKTQSTFRHLLTHTCAFCYGIWDAKMSRYTASKPPVSARPGPLMFEPGARWQYGQGVDWAGRLVEAIRGATLDGSCEQGILRAVGWSDSRAVCGESGWEGLAGSYRRRPNRELQESQRTLPSRPKTFNGGGGLYSTVGDYTRFMQMILNRGKGPRNVRILRAATVESMATNQIGDLPAGKMKSFEPETSADVDFQPGHTQKWGLGFLINTTPNSGGRSAGSLAWAGISNTFYWIDPKRNRCAVLMMQYLPFVDSEAVGLLGDFEQAVYRNL